ncbi:Aromatic ring-opening dioxygenase, LigB subunit, partial [Mycobacterium terramassiliense]
VLGAIAIVPSAPVLVPELAGAAAAEVADLTAAVLAAAALLPPRWVAVGTGQADDVFEPESSGTFAGFGADVRVGLSPRAAAPGDLPVCALLAGWVRAQARPDAGVQVRVYRRDHDAETALARGRGLRAELDRAPEPIGVLVVADGANTLTPSAPGGHHPGDADAQATLDDALADGDVAALAGLPPRILGRVAFQVLAGLTGPGPRSAKELYRGAPYGVGYFAGFWQL